MQTKLSKYYGDDFYEGQVSKSLQSARIYLGHLWRLFQPASVLDVGCGRGTWLQACHELGAEKLVGLDGEWNNQTSMLDDAISFKSIDLNEPFTLPEMVDLAMTLEVAEHLQQESSAEFVRSLTGTSEAILFSAAYSGQGGTNHVNEQPHTFWADLFAQRGFAVFDVFRPLFWDNDAVAYWYRQNAFLYVKRGSKPYLQLCGHGLAELTDVGFMNCVHPELYTRKIVERAPLTFRSHIIDLAPSLARALRRRGLKLPAAKQAASFDQ
jgi:SAM-dependent methyltransferase